LLDTYDTPSYISTSNSNDHPTRYLSTSSSSTQKAQKFESPNIITGTAAAILSLSTFRHPAVEASVVLLPTSLEKEWSNGEMQDVHHYLLPATGDWKKAGGQGAHEEKRRRKGQTDIGEGGMYI